MTTRDEGVSSDPTAADNHHDMSDDAVRDRSDHDVSDPSDHDVSDHPVSVEGELGGKGVVGELGGEGVVSELGGEGSDGVATAQRRGDTATDDTLTISSVPAPRRSGSRSRVLAFAGLVGGGLLGIVASAQPWWRASGDGADVPFTGSDSTAGLSQALVIVGLAGTLLVLALRIRGKQVVSVLVALTGLGMLTTGLLRLRPTDSAVRTKLREISLADQFALEPTVWSWMYATAGLLVAAGAVIMLLRAARWPQRADRFERTGSAPAAITPDTDSSVLWKAIDAGVDPTDAVHRPSEPDTAKESGALRKPPTRRGK